MTNFGIALEILENDMKTPGGLNKITGSSWINICRCSIKGLCKDCLHVQSYQKHYIVCGAEFGLENNRKGALIRKSLYDPDIWMRPATHCDGSNHYEYILVYTDDALAIGEHPEKLLYQGIDEYFQLKRNELDLQRYILVEVFARGD
eukprot:7519597-Ditylum_brightwellii.AAC.1